MKLKHLYILYKNNIADMKYLKKFENFSGYDSNPDLGDRFTNEPEEVMLNVMPKDGELMPDGEEVMPGNDEENCAECDGNYEEEEKEETWGDEENNPLVVEKKKINKGFQAFLDKQKAKKEDKKEDKKDNKKAKPDFLDLDKDGDKKESMKKAAKEAKEKETKKKK
jgi:hypothetical protein